MQYSTKLWYRSDAGGVCGNPIITASATQRPNIRFGTGTATWTNLGSGTVAGNTSTLRVVPGFTTTYQYAYNSYAGCNAPTANTTVTVQGSSAQPDAGASSINSPLAGAVVNTAQAIKVYVKNMGNTIITTCGMGYNVNGIGVSNEIFNGVVNPGDSTLFTFATTWTPTASGSYLICVNTNLAGDVNAANNSKCVTVSSSVGIDDLAATVGKVYPNPTQNVFWIEPTNSQTTQVFIYDKLGKLVHTQAINQKTEINLSQLAQGVYSYHLLQANNQQKGQVILVK
jgi:hypothetical protein